VSRWEEEKWTAAEVPKDLSDTKEIVELSKAPQDVIAEIDNVLAPKK
jgi:hypothetical protein